MTTFPFVTVIMPIRNESDFIERSLGAVLAQDYPHTSMEVLIADGMSTDDTRAIVERTAAGTPDITVTIVDNPGQIVPTGFNAALNKAKGEIIVRVDGHTLIERDYVRQCVETLQRTGADNAGGRMDPVSSTTFGQAVALATSSPFGVGGARFHYSDQEEWVDTVYMGAWPRRVFDRIGPFDAELVRNQDDEFNYRLRSSGGKILLNPAIRSTYYNRSTWKALWRQYFQYGYWKIRVLQKHPLQMRARQFVPPAFAAALVGSAGLMALWRPARWLFGFVVGAYAAANLVASGLTAKRARGNAGLWLPLVFATLHLSYGLGFWRGMIAFFDRWTDASAESTQGETRS